MESSELNDWTVQNWIVDFLQLIDLQRGCVQVSVVFDTRTGHPGEDS